MQLDEFDIKLLRFVQHNNRLTADELSGRVGLSPSACQRRLAKLRRSGVIERDIAVVSPIAVGRQLTMVVQVTLERTRASCSSANGRTSWMNSNAP